MSTADVLNAAQQLDGEAYVELYELDTSPLFEIHGVGTPGGVVYRWASGIIDVRSEGTLPDGVYQSDSVITLDRLLPLVSGRTYQLAVDLGDGVDHPPVVISTISTATIMVGSSSIVVSQVFLSLPLASTPVAGAAWTLIGTNSIKFRGNEYVPMPIEAAGFEWAGTGKLPRPKLRVSNIGGYAAALLIAHGDLLGAQVTRIRTFRRFLDDGEDADPTAFFEPDIFLIDRKSAHNKAVVEFELAAALDQQGLRIPRRIMLRDTCGHTYRKWATTISGVTGFINGTCPYAGSAYFKVDGSGTFTPSEDVCGLRQSDCVLRFGNNANLPFNAFPGISIAS